MANLRWCVYVHTNIITGMKYVGRTAINPLHRWGLEGNGYDINNVFGQAIAEYGWNNFTHEILVYGITNVEEADALEREYIKAFNSIYPFGYNTEDGGIHGSTNPHEPKEKRPLTGWHHSDETKRKISESYDHSKHLTNMTRRTPVDCYDLEGNYLATFSGAVEASEETGCDISTIVKCCKYADNPIGHPYKTCGGYIWRYHYNENDF